MDIKEKYEFWLKNVKDETLLQELKTMTEEQISTAFFKDMEFGTAGLRGTVGAGSNCMNIYTVGQTTRAICKHLKMTGGKSIAVSYDSRIMSKEFAELVACICAKNDITTYLVKDMMPTPYLSFLVRFYHTDMGVMITASHNPKIAKTLDLFDLEYENLEEAVKEGKVIYADDEPLESYKAEVREQSRTDIENVIVVYSALNGTGIKTLPEILEECGA